MLAAGGPQTRVNSSVQALCQGQPVGRCRTSRRAEEAIRAGTCTSWRRIVPVVAVACRPPVRVPAARVRLNAMTARMSQAALAAKTPSLILSPFADHAADLAICVATGVVDAGGWGSRQHGPMSFDGLPLGVSRRWLVPRIAEVRCSPRAWASASRSSRLSCSSRRSRSVDASSRRSSEASEARCRLGGMRLDGCAW